MRRSLWVLLALAMLSLASVLPAATSRADTFAPPLPEGYWLVTGAGEVFGFGDAQVGGSLAAVRLNAPVVGIAARWESSYWLVAADGGVFAFGGAPFLGSLAGVRLAAPVVGMGATPSGNGYWLLAADGGVFAFGDAAFLGSAATDAHGAPAVAIEPYPSGQGYLLLFADNRVRRYGDAALVRGDTPRAAHPAVGMALTLDTVGLWTAGRDGGVFTYDEAPFLGGLAGTRLVAPVVAIDRSLGRRGYWMAAADGGVFAFGNARFMGSAAGKRLKQPVVAMAALHGGSSCRWAPSRQPEPVAYPPSAVPPHPAVVLTLELDDDEAAAGGDVGGVLTVENYCGWAVAYRATCPATWGLYQDGERRSAARPTCGAEEDVRLRAYEGRRFSLRFGTLDDAGSALPAGEYEAFAGVENVQDAPDAPKGTWYAPPLRVTVVEPS